LDAVTPDLDQLNQIFSRLQDLTVESASSLVSDLRMEFNFDKSAREIFESQACKLVTQFHSDICFIWGNSHVGINSENSLRELIRSILFFQRKFLRFLQQVPEGTNLEKNCASSLSEFELQVSQIDAKFENVRGTFGDA